MAKQGAKQDDAPDADGAVVVHKLGSPILSMGEPVHELRLRAPTGRDILAVGNPVLVNVFHEDPVSTVRFDYPVLGNMIARLANVPRPSLDQCEPADLQAIGWKLTRFFFPREG